MNWTDKQRQVIETRNCDLLVSAAAGSGKTAVLVERIIRLISEGPRPIDIDNLLVMTFTNAAAAEMRERIGAAIEKKLAEEPDSEHLQAQAALVPYAQITTIDSFCLSLIRDHFNLLDIDPGFRIGDEGEMLLLRADVMRDMLEDYYAAGDEMFGKFVDTFATGKTDSGVEDYILQVYNFAQSNPFPGQWLDRCRRELEELEKGSMENAPWMRFLMADVKRQTEELVEQYEAAAELCREPDGPQSYLPVILDELSMLKRIAAAGNYDELYEALQHVEFGRLRPIRKGNVDPAKKDRAADCRDRVKKALGNLQEAYGTQTGEEAAADILGTRDVVLKLLELAEDFSGRYQAAKKDKNLVDFNDLEHYALQILVEEPKEGAEDELHFTETADQLSRQYAEILVDEYQDSNYVQETLIRSLSGERFGRPDVFMVGDVKQSIYRFRLARPDIFMEKYETYQSGEGPRRKIELRQNFRSRDTVLSAINRIFYQIMTKNLGNVDYTEETALHPGAVFPEGERTGTPVELLLVDTGKASMSALDEEAADYTARELEAKMIAMRMRQLTDPQTGLRVWDKAKGAYRPAGYGDMVILLRSMTGWSETFLQVLTREGIPAYAETGTGYFDTIEVETVLALLAVIDNPIQDIPLAAVLRSPVVGMDEEELAWMMAAYKKEAGHCQDRGIYGAFCYMTEEDGTGKDWNFGEDGVDAPEEEIQRVRCLRTGAEKLRRFGRMLEEFRAQAAYLPIHELIDQVYARTGYYDYVSAMPAGETRRANLDMLVEKAMTYEKTSYKGLFQFIRYINLLKKYETDFGEASAGKYENMVRLMSIHKSKGLEFPIVFLAAMGKQFNRQDVRGRLIIDADLGIGTDYLDLERRVKCASLKKSVLKRKMDLDNLGEELRILYVAMTRAKEKLIMTGSDRSLYKKLEKWNRMGSCENETKGARPPQLPYTVLSGAGSFLDWVLMSQPSRDGLMDVRLADVAELAGNEAAEQIRRRVGRQELMRLAAAADEEMDEKLRQCLAGPYAHEADVNLYTKMTVSELKKMGQQLDDYDGLMQAAEPEYLRDAADGRGEADAGAGRAAQAAGDGRGEAADAGGGRVAQADRGGRAGADAGDRKTAQADRGGLAEAAAGDSQGQPACGETAGAPEDVKAVMARAARRGTAYHRVLELLDFTQAETAGDVRHQLQTLVQKGRIDSEMSAMVRADVILRFALSPLGRRMKAAQPLGRLHREQQFVMGIPAREMGMGDSDEPVLIQGIIDAYLEEEDGLVLVDYKTDRVEQGQVLAQRYRVQLDYYQRALEQMRKGQVKERVIYSLSLQEEVPV